MAKKPKRAAKQKPAKGRASPKANQAVQAPVIKGSTAIAGRALETGHILVVDDEEFSRSIITRQLVNITRRQCLFMAIFCPF